MSTRGKTGPPPLGLRPRYIVESLRMSEILEAMHRYATADKLVPLEWLAELSDIVHGQHARTKGGVGMRVRKIHPLTAKVYSPTETSSGGHRYWWGLANINGIHVHVFLAAGSSQEDADKAVADIRRERDVVSATWSEV